MLIKKEPYGSFFVL